VLPAVFLVSVFCRYQICWIFGISVGIDPPLFVYFPPFPPPFFPKGGGASQKGGHCPPFEEKGGTAPFLIPKCTDRIFLRYRYGKYREIPTEYRPKIPNRYTTLILTYPTHPFILPRLLRSASSASSGEYTMHGPSPHPPPPSPSSTRVRRGGFTRSDAPCPDAATGYHPCRSAAFVASTSSALAGRRRGGGGGEATGAPRGATTIRGVASALGPHLHLTT